AIPGADRWTTYAGAAGRRGREDPHSRRRRHHPCRDRLHVGHRSGGTRPLHRRLAEAQRHVGVCVRARDTAVRKATAILALGAAPGARFRHRGVTVHKDRVFVSYRSFLYALDKATGTPIASFGSGGRIDLREGLGMPADKLSVSASTPGVVFDDLLIMGSSVPETIPGSPGHIRAFDVNSGKLRWIFHTIPQPGEFGYDTWSKDA